jgi:hypothetical protein
MDGANKGNPYGRCIFTSSASDRPGDIAFVVRGDGSGLGLIHVSPCCAQRKIVQAQMAAQKLGPGRSNSTGFFLP